MTLLFISAALAALSPAPDLSITCSAVIPASVSETWKAYTSTEGISAWMVARGTVDLKVGGKYRTSYDPKSKLDGPEVIESTILSFDPGRMMSMKCTKTPEKFPFKKAMEGVWTVLYFRPVDAGKTEVVCRMVGYDGTPESNQMRAFFDKNNQLELDELVKYFKDKK